MNNSSVSRSRFEGIKWSNVQAFLDVVGRATIRSKSIIERKYQEVATNFTATADFLIEARSLRLDVGEFYGLVSLPAERIKGRDAFIAHLVDLNGSRVRDELFGYLSSFDLTSQTIPCFTARPGPAEHSAVRNFLMEMGIVRYHDPGKIYVLDPGFGWLIALAHTRARPIRPSQLSLGLQAQEDVGAMAERQVVSWERNRLGNAHAHRVEHMAENNCAAGFDILSATVAGPELQQRFIEVKAVPQRTMRFYWTSNEIAVARVVGPLYFLYLVPIQAGGAADLDRMVIVPDPCLTVIHGENWVTEPNVLECQLRQADSMEGAIVK